MHNSFTLALKEVAYLESSSTCSNAIILFVNSWKYIQKLFGQKLDRSYAVLTSYQSLHVLSMNFPLSQFRVATHQKVKNSLTFH